jgi:hypothetical protein
MKVKALIKRARIALAVVPALLAWTAVHRVRGDVASESQGRRALDG